MDQPDMFLATRKRSLQLNTSHSPKTDVIMHSMEVRFNLNLFQANSRRWHNVVLILSRCHRLWPIIKPAPCQHLPFAEFCFCVFVWLKQSLGRIVWITFIIFIFRGCILIQDMIYRRLRIGRDSHLDKFEAYYLSYLVREYRLWTSTAATACILSYGSLF